CRNGSDCGVVSALAAGAVSGAMTAHHNKTAKRRQLRIDRMGMNLSWKFARPHQTELHAWPLWRRVPSPCDAFVCARSTFERPQANRADRHAARPVIASV